MDQTHSQTNSPEPSQAFLDPGEVLEEEFQLWITEHIIDDIEDIVEAFPSSIIYSVITIDKKNSMQFERLCLSFEKGDWAEDLCREIDENLSYFKSTTPENVVYAAMTHSVHRIIEVHDRLGWYRIQIVIPLW